MRCRNCGWSNPDGATSCEKCKQPLESCQPAMGAQVVQESFQPVQENLRKTIRESRPYDSQPSVQMSPDSSVCSKCGYPLAEGTEYCPSCGNPINAVQEEKPKKVIARNATINPWARRDNICTLSPIDWNGTPVPRAGLVKEFQDSVILTRDNTMPENKTITSQEQAEMVFKDGRWCIIDKSEQHTTFVLATREITLQNGDIVMLGNQLFRFNDGNASK